MMTAETVADRLARVRERIAAAAVRAGRRPDDVTLVGASKTVEPARLQAALDAGLLDLGENYVQEAQAKQAVLGRAPAGLRWHLIGHLQSNKARTAVEHFDIIQSLDSRRLGERLARHVPLGRRLPVLLEVDYTGLPERSGVRPQDVPPLVDGLLGLASLELVGLMTVPAPGEAEAATRETFRRLGRLREELTVRYPGVGWQHLSMGMTDDFEWAIEEGATIVRVGRAIFGARS